MVMVAAQLCMALVAGSWTADVPSQVAADEMWATAPNRESLQPASFDAIPESPIATAEEYELPSSVPVAVPEVATLLFLASGGALLTARHRHPRRPRA